MNVSVIVPTRNRGRLLPATLRSALRQQGVDFEIIVVDDASTDETPAVVGALAAQVRLIRHETPLGVSAARNRGVAESRGTWLAFLDDDDLWAPEKLARQLDAAEAQGRDWAYAGAVVISYRGLILRAQHPLPPDEMVAALRRYDAVPGGGSNVVVRRTAFARAGGFDTRLRSGEDWEMWIRLAKAGPPACVSLPLVAKRLHPSNATLDMAEIVRGTRFIEALHDLRADWGRLHRWMGYSALRAGWRRTALRQFTMAALRGELFGVASDAVAILGEGLGRGVPRRDDEHALSGDPWLTGAAAWLDQLPREG